jgi:two-component system, response regulator YesN
MSYLNRYRVQQAKKMLEEGKRCITDIALEVGFSNSGYFTRVFREEVGVSPREYLLKNGKNGSNC